MPNSLGNSAGTPEMGFQTSSEIMDEVGRFINAKQTPEIIAHYTDDKGLYGILKEGIIRLSDTASMNDPTEIGHGVNLTIEAIDASVGIDDSIRHTLKSALIEHRDRGGLYQSAAIVIASFSSHLDHLGQWRAYSDNGSGFCLHFDAKILEEHFISSVTKSAQRSTFNVTYSDPTLLSFLQKSVVVAGSSLSRLADADIGEAARDDIYHEVISDFLTSISAISLGFKNEAYKEEREFRFMHIHDGPIEAASAKERLAHYKLVRFIEFDWKNGAKNALKTILVGPVGGDRAEKFVNDCKRHFGLTSTEVQRSIIPYRP